MNELSIILPCEKNFFPISYIDNLTNFLMVNPSDVDLIIIMNENNDQFYEIKEYVKIKYQW